MDAAKRATSDLVRIDLGQAEGLEKAFHKARGLDGLLVQWDFLFSILASEIAQRAAQERIPAIYENRAQVVAGGLMSYGSDVRETFRQGAGYVDRILKGARPADLPVIQASRYELIINKGTATTLGLAIPDTLLTQADEIIE
jgi:putative ABC transport system substrate-binding protein